MKGYDDIIKKCEDKDLINGMVKTFFADLITLGFEYYGRDENSNVINLYVENNPIDMDKLHKKLNRIQGPDDNLEIERFSKSNPAPKRNVQNDYFNKVVKESVGKADVKKDKSDKCISIIRNTLEIRKSTQVREFASRSKVIPNKLVNTLVRILSGKNEENLNYEEEQKLKNLYTTFNRRSTEVLGKIVKYTQNVLFHFLRKIGKEPDMNDFYIQSSESVKKTNEEIKNVFDKLDWSM